MPRSIASQRIAKNRIAGKPIASRYASEALQTPYLFNPTTPSPFRVPKTGKWKFVGWGPGGGTDFTNGGGSGAYFEITKDLKAQQSVAIVVGLGNSSTDTTVTFPDGTLATAGRASGATGGTASLSGVYSANLDVTINGRTATGSNPGPTGGGTAGGAGGTSAGGGAGAPGNLPFYGGAGGVGGSTVASTGSGHTPGGGAGSGNSPVGYKAGDGQVVVYLVSE